MSRNLPYDRSQRLAERVCELVSEIVQVELADPRFEGVRITRVRLTKDLRLARVNYLVEPNTEAKKKKAREGLEGAKAYVRSSIAESITFRFVPEVRFCYDDAMEEGARVEELLKTVTRGS